MCGIPSIKLLGNKSDYLKIIDNLKFIRSFDLEWWVDP
ncbi:MAG: DUF4419 domain-containing protein [Methyloprofundus sp.]|nr:DUF4419 domain-containing protein [Methyloprofundus sp.]